MNATRTVCYPLTAGLTLVFLAGSCALRPEVPLGVRARNAQTAEGHAAVAAAYRERAERLRKEAAEHMELATWWSSLAGGKAPATGTGRYEEAQHCRRFAENLLAAAKEADMLAEVHGTQARAEGGR
jgi:hypothetical protein